jgi:hypothetical protein
MGAVNFFLVTGAGKGVGFPFLGKDVPFAIVYSLFNNQNNNLGIMLRKYYYCTHHNPEGGPV